MTDSIDERVDVKENMLESIDHKILSILLKDKTTRQNIIWATNDYAHKGDGYYFDQQITVDLITGLNGNVIRPRIEKNQDEQISRVKNKAEVFTPSWVCNRQNNIIDNDWFGRNGVFNIETENGWIATKEKIQFPKEKNWKAYVVAKRLEISCGEAPYLVSRYDTVTGQPIPVEQRIGLLDRKLRVICDNCDSEYEWVKWAIKAYQSIYGYEWQGDNVLIARENLLYTFIDYYFYKFSRYPTTERLINISNIIAWNIWQMDGLCGVVPYSCHNTVETETQLTLFGEPDEPEIKPCPGCAKNDLFSHTGIYCRIFDWTNLKKSVTYVSLFKGDNKHETI